MSSVEKNKVTSLEIIVRMIDDKPYYEVKYREVGKKEYSIGYSSYSLKTVLGFGNDGMGGELVVNLDDAIEIIKGGGKE